ncbi:hypothetical protein ACLKA6_005638 [Drosophila palustris]
MFQLYALILEISRGRSIFYFNPRELDCNWSWLQQHNLTSQPQWVWNRPFPYIQLKEQHNSELFVLACISEEYHKDELLTLLTSLVHLRSVKVLIEVADCQNPCLRSKLSMAQEILFHFPKFNMLNVALYFQFNKDSPTLYSFEAFPRFTLLQHNFTKSEGVQLFPNQMENLRGYTLRVVPETSIPNTIIYTDANGKKFIRGFMWDFIETFAKKINATPKVILPTWPAGRYLDELYALEWTKNGSVDIGLFTSPMNKIYYNSWCIMMPLERPIGIPAIFWHILKADALALLIIALSCYWFLTKVEGSLFPTWKRYWHIFLKLLVLFVICFSQAQLLFLMIFNPRQVPIDSFEALLASDLRIFGVNAEFYLMQNEFRARYATAFRLTNNVSEFFELRNSFNTSFAYSISSIKWSVMETQQRNFQRSVFRYSDLCLHETMPYSILLDEDSPYYEAIKFFSMKIHEAGLFDHWLRYSFYDMVKAGRMHFKDYSISIQPRPLRLHDFRIPCLCFAVGIILCLFLFTVELLRFYIPVFLDSL